MDGYITRRGGGGSSPSGDTQDFALAKNNVIKKWDYVRNVENTFNAMPINATYDDLMYSGGGRTASVRIDDERLLQVRMFSNGYLYAFITSVQGRDVSFTIPVQVTTATNVSRITLTKLTDRKVLLMYKSSAYGDGFQGAILTIDAYGIGVGVTTNLRTSILYGSYCAAVATSETRVLLFYSYGSYYASACLIIDIVDDVPVVVANPANTPGNYTTRNGIRAHLLPNGKVLLLLGMGTTTQRYELQAVVITVNGTTLSAATATLLGDLYSFPSDKLSYIAIEDYDILILHSYTSSSCLYASRITINPTSGAITIKKGVQLSSQASSGGDANLTFRDAQGKIQHVYRDADLVLHVVEILVTDTKISLGDDYKMLPVEYLYTAQMDMGVFDADGLVFLLFKDAANILRWGISFYSGAQVAETMASDLVGVATKNSTGGMVNVLLLPGVE